MCGIAGIIEFKHEEYHVSALKNMTESMKNRGPDDEGFLLSNNSVQTFFGNNSAKNINKVKLPYSPKDHINTAENIKSKIAFGFKRLSILDLTYNAHQPMCDSEQRFWIIFNGEIYNYKEIRKELVSLKHSFYSNSDTEVVLKAYMQWGEKSLQKFNGMFAFSIFDTTKKEVFLARDRMGIKPLYFYHDRNRFIFASTIKAIIDSKLYTPEIHWEGLWQNYNFSIAQRPNTCFSNISALEPSKFLKINIESTKITKSQYWDIPTGTQDFSLTEKKAANLLEEALYKSIDYRLQADVEVGTFMSGGIDSTLVSAIASKIQPNIKAFTLGFDKEFSEYSEVTQARDTASLNAIDHIVHYANPNIVIDNIEDIITGYEEPYHHLPANYVISNIVAEHKVKVILNGLGGDELFAGYHFYKKLKWWPALKNLNPLFKLLPGHFNNRLDVAKRLASYQNISQYYAHFNTTFNDTDNRRLFINKEYNTLNIIENLYEDHHKFTDGIEALSYYNLKSYISNHQTRTIDQFTMNFSIEGRFPLLDHKFIELAFRIPSKYKIKNGVQKHILRQVAKKYIAPSCLEMNKKGFGLPLEYWYKHELKDFIRDKINLLKNRHFFNNNEIDNIIKNDNVRKIWQLVTTEIWLQKFFKTH